MLLYRAIPAYPLRAGGFISAAYIALYFNRPYDLLFIAVVSLTSYFAVRLISKWLLVFGRTTIAMLMITTMLISWAGELILMYTFNYIPWQGMTILAPIIAALLANDANKQGFSQTAIGISIASSFVFLGMFFLF